MEKDGIELSFTMKRSDIARAFIEIYRCSWLYKVILLIGSWALMFGVVLFIRVFNGDDWGDVWSSLFSAFQRNTLDAWAMKILLLCASMLILFREFMISLLAYVFRYNIHIGNRVQMHLTEEGVHSNADGFTSFVPWIKIHKAVFTSTHILLFLSQRSALIVPLRAFENPQQQHRAYDYLRQYISAPFVER